MFFDISIYSISIKSWKITKQKFVDISIYSISIKLWNVTKQKNVDVLIYSISIESWKVTKQKNDVPIYSISLKSWKVTKQKFWCLWLVGFWYLGSTVGPFPGIAVFLTAFITSGAAV